MELVARSRFLIAIGTLFLLALMFYSQVTDAFSSFKVGHAVSKTNQETLGFLDRTLEAFFDGDDATAVQTADQALKSYTPRLINNLDGAPGSINEAVKGFVKEKVLGKVKETVNSIGDKISDWRGDKAKGIAYNTENAISSIEKYPEQNANGRGWDDFETEDSMDPITRKIMKERNRKFLENQKHSDESEVGDESENSRNDKSRSQETVKAKLERLIQAKKDRQKTGSEDSRNDNSQPQETVQAKLERLVQAKKDRQENGSESRERSSNVEPEENETYVSDEEPWLPGYDCLVCPWRDQSVSDEDPELDKIDNETIREKLKEFDERLAHADSENQIDSELRERERERLRIEKQIQSQRDEQRNKREIRERELAKIERVERIEGGSSSGECKREDPNVINAMQDAQERARGSSAATAHCANANMRWIIVWKGKQCLSDSSLTSTELQQVRNQMKVAAEQGRVSAEAHSVLTDGSSVCECWSRYCER